MTLFFNHTKAMRQYDCGVVTGRGLLRIFYLLFMGILMMVSCTDSPHSSKNQRTARVPQASDSLYTRQAAMNIFAYQPQRALQILDSAVIVGNISPWFADLMRTKIYSSSLMHDQLDSLLGGPSGVRLDSARLIGERLLNHDSVKVNLKRQLDILEMLAYTARQKNDTAKWLSRSREFVDICHQIGAEQETNALRTEAEMGAALCALGQPEKGMWKLDSVITLLDASLHREHDRGAFAELDALIIALKRKISQLSLENKYAETLPLARRIIEQLDDYEKYPDIYHDGTYREPKDSIHRLDYIRFYRNQAQSYITAAYAALGEQGNMLKAFEEIERGVREATAREHIAHYHALRQQMEADRLQAQAKKSRIIAMIIGVIALLFLIVSFVIIFQNRIISRKNRLLAKQIAEAVHYKKMFWEEKREEAISNDISNPNSLTDEELFQHINDVIVRERLFLDSKFERQTIMDRFHLSKEKVGAVFSSGSHYSKLSTYLQQLRLEYAAKLLIEQPDKSIVQIAAESGFSSNTYFSNCFRQYFSISPSDFRRDAVDLLSKQVH